MADVSREQFEESKAVTKKIFQKGKLALDADLNEQIDIDDNFRRRILSAITGHADVSFSEGFRPLGTGASLQVTIQKGFASFQQSSQSATLLYLAEDTTLSGFTAWSGARTDYIYIDIEEKEFSPTDDSDLINPIAGEESTRDMRYVYSFNISEGSAPGAPPAGHTYVNIATVTKTSGSNIESSEVTLLIHNFVVYWDEALGKVTTRICNGFRVDSADILFEVSGANGLEITPKGATNDYGIKVNDNSDQAGFQDSILTEGNIVANGKLTVGASLTGASPASDGAVFGTNAFSQTVRSIFNGTILINAIEPATVDPAVLTIAGNLSGFTALSVESGDVSFSQGLGVLGGVSVGGTLGVGDVAIFVDNLTTQARRILSVLDSAVSSASDTIESTHEVIRITPTNAITMSSTPTIDSAGAMEGQRIVIHNETDFNLTLQDESNLTGSKLRFNGGSNLVLSNHQAVILIYLEETGVGFWHQIGSTA